VTSFLKALLSKPWFAFPPVDEARKLQSEGNLCNFRRKQTSGIKLKNDINYVNLNKPSYTKLNTMSESIPANESPAQKQARLRRERRNAKIAAGGSSRLAAIMNSSGRQHAAEAETGRFRLRYLTGREN
jgi:hypothetical protein